MKYDDPKNLSNWFDPHDPRHVEAYWCVVDEGAWPTWFVQQMVQEGVVIDDHWESLIRHKCVVAWIERSRKENT